MTERSAFELRPEHQAGCWENLSASVNDLIRRRPSALFADEYDRAQPLLRDRVDCGLCAVPMYRIALGTPRYSLFEQWLPQPSTSHLAQPNQQMQPVALYKVGDVYYVRDGNRRIATARSRGQMFLRAHVVEYTLQGPSHPPDVLAQLVTHERTDFFARWFFPHSHAARTMHGELLGSYDHLTAHIESVCAALHLQGISHDAALLRWYDELYAPVARVIQYCDVLRAFPNCGEADLYLWAVERNGQSTAERSFRDQQWLARQNVLMLWMASHNQHAGERG